jgi:hypothetical protein
MDWASSVVAIGTLVLAVGTVILAWQTRKLASTSAADLQAQWRPIVLPGSSSRLIIASRPMGLGLDHSSSSPTACLRAFLAADSVEASASTRMARDAISA